MVQRKSSHRRMLEKIAYSPSSFGIDNVIYSSIEPSLIHNGKIIAQPDVVFYCQGDRVYIIEFKGDGNGEMLRRARNQINNAVYWFGRYTNLDPEKIETKIVTPQDKDLREIL